jgi:hypothetical protein
MPRHPARARITACHLTRAWPCRASACHSLRAGAANLSASGLKRQDNDLIVIESAGAAAAFKHSFESRFASGEALPAGARAMAANWPRSSTCASEARPADKYAHG